MKRYLIVGNGCAAVSCIEGIRSVDPEGSITVLSEEPCAAYCRPLISYYLEGRTDEARMQYRPEDFYEKNNCTVLYGTSAQKIDPVRKTVLLQDGSTLPYDALCVAAGSSPFVPLLEGLDTAKEHFSFLTLADAKALKAAAAPDKRVLIIGAGLIGLKCAEGLHGLVKSITVVDLADRVLSSILDADGAAVAQKALESAGLCLHLGDSVARFEDHSALLKSGKTVEFDILVTAVGVRPNVSLVRDAGGKVGRGITIDEKTATTLPDVYAAGDCTESTDLSDGRVKVMALMPNAVLQGFTAGVNMAGGSKTLTDLLPMNSIGFFGCRIMTAGSPGEPLVNEVTGSSVKKLYTDGTHLTGFEIIGDVRGTGIYTKLIRTRTDITEIDPENMKITPSLGLFQKNDRVRMLGGVI